MFRIRVNSLLYLLKCNTPLFQILTDLVMEWNEIFVAENRYKNVMSYDASSCLLNLL